jgi:uncharacterized protein (DUF736 family)
MKEFVIFKNTDKKSEKSPDYRLMMNIEGNWIEIGGGWNRKSGKGTNFISCRLSNQYKDRKGYNLIEDEKKEDLNNSMGL